jgi:hypothetical protein
LRQRAHSLWLTAINIVGVLAGPGWHALVIALAGGGGMLLAGDLSRRRRRDLP